MKLVLTIIRTVWILGLGVFGMMLGASLGYSNGGWIGGIALGGVGFLLGAVIGGLGLEGLIFVARLFP